jgi:trans-aconitate 2-methyltransferase
VRSSRSAGGEGNVAGLHAAVLDAIADTGLDERFAGWPGPWNFASPENTRERLHAAGFADAECWLEPWPVMPTDPRAYLQTVCMGPFLERLDAPEQARLLDAVMSRLGEHPTLDYVRLNIVARRGSA